MSLQPNCLDNIIGLSRTSCSCFTSGMPFDANTSKSELYLDELEGLNLDLANSINDCEQGSLWDIMERARENAIKTTKADVMAGLLQLHTYKRNPFSGNIGDPRFSKSLDLTNNYYGVRLFCANIIGGIAQLKRIGLIMDSNALFNISIFDDINEYAIATYQVVSQPNQLTWFNLPSPLNLDMNNYSSSYPNYYIVYEKAAFKPKDCKWSCGCGGAYPYYFNTKSPRFTTGEKFRWGEYVMPTGISGSDIGERENWGTDGYTYGLILDMEFKCKVDELVCKDQLDFQSNPLAFSLASAIRFKAGAFLLDSILASGQINRFTMTDRERLMQKKNTYTEQYSKFLQYLVQQTNIKANDCLKCNDFDDLMKVGIYS